MDVLNRIKAQWGKLDESWRFAITAFLIVRTFYALWSWVILTVQPVAVHYVEVESRPAVLFLDLHTNQTYTYLRNLQGVQLTFRSASSDSVADLQTGSTWDLRSGKAIAGYYDGSALTPMVSPADMFSYFGATPYSNPWLALWQRFDANWYTSIAEFGYGSIPGDYAFPPLFPLLIRMLMPLTGNAFLAGLLISHTATLYALKVLYEVFSQWKNRQVAQQALVSLLIFPASFFLFSAYTEPLFLVLVLLALQCMERRSWLWAGFWTFLAILTRLQGIALMLPMLFLILREHPLLLKPQHWAGVIIAGSGFLFYLFLRSMSMESGAAPFTDPVWHARLVLPWEAYAIAIQNLLSMTFNYIDVLNWATTTIVMILLVVGGHTLPTEYNLYSIASLLVMLSRVVDGQPLLAMMRYSLSLFPIYFIIGMAGRTPWRRRILYYSCIVLNLYLSADFFQWSYVA